MVGWCLAVMVLLVPLTLAVESNLPYPTFSACDTKIINTIKNVFWALGTPSNLLKKAEQVQGFSLVHSTFDQLQEYNCIRCNVSSEQSKIDFFFYKKNGGETGILSYHVEVNGTELIAQNGKTKLYPIILNDNLFAYYVCSPDSDTKNQPLISVLTSTKSLYNPLVQGGTEMLFSQLKSSLGRKIAALFKTYDQCTSG